MSEPNGFEILLVEDDPRDADLTVRAMKKHNLANKLHVLEDGAEALDFIFGRGKYQQRDACTHPKVIFLDLKLPKVSGMRAAPATQGRRKTQFDSCRDCELLTGRPRYQTGLRTGC